MALSVAVMVGDAQDWIPELVERSKHLTVGAGTENKDVCPMITKASLERAENIIA
jgi:malonate-semialdehyde dehydrogenase (acetylating)/methylmalonate-semialdehyde dehydrogenase